MWDIPAKPKSDTGRTPTASVWDVSPKPKADANGARPVLPWDTPPDATVIGPPLSTPSPPPLPPRAARTGAVEAGSPQATPQVGQPGTGADDIWPVAPALDLPAGNADDRPPLTPPKLTPPKLTPPKPIPARPARPKPRPRPTPPRRRPSSRWDVPDRSNGDAMRAPADPPWKARAETRTAETKTGETKTGDGRARAASPWDAPPDATMIGPPLVSPEPPRAAGTHAAGTAATETRPRQATSQIPTKIPTQAPNKAPNNASAKIPTEVPPDSAEFYMPLARRPALDDDSPNPVLPVPPSDTEKYAYVRRHAWVLTLCAALSIPPLVYGQARMVLNSPWFWVYVPFALFGVLCFVLSVTADGMSRSFDLDEHKRIVASWMPLWHPSVDVFLPVCGEPLEVLRNAWTHVARLRSHYPGQVTPYVLDDSANPEIKAMARRFGFAYATRPDRGRFKKSGNLLYGFTISDGDYILLLDADFAPRPDLLDETLPYMALFPDVGIVQTPQFFHVLDEQTWVERGAGASQELFYRSIQTARANRDAAICVGSCAVYRRKALERTRACRWPSTPKTCTPGLTCAGSAGACATCRSRSPRATARTTSSHSSTSSTAGARAR